MGADCLYCGHDIEILDPDVFEHPRHQPSRVTLGQFCNVGCLSAFIEKEGLAAGSRCDASC